MSSLELSNVQVLLAQGGYVDCIWGHKYELNDVSELASFEKSYVVALPFRAAETRGFVMSATERRSGAPIVAVTIEAERRISRERFVHLLHDSRLPTARDVSYEPDSSRYAELVERVIRDDIAGGRGSNFVTPRVLAGVLSENDVRAQQALFVELLSREPTAYMTFWCDLGDSALVGASPELHVRKDSAGSVTMNPVSGTLVHDGETLSLPELRSFLSDEKERDELHMVVDEEMKFMASVCDDVPCVEGPYLKHLARVTHTEYYLAGTSSLSVEQILRRSMFAPTVLGSPLESAFTVAADRDIVARRYFGGVLARVDRLPHGSVLDSAILIRTLEIERSGAFRYPVGATLVRHSNSEAEVAETIGKTQAVLSMLSGQPHEEADQEVSKLLSSRRDELGSFWTQRSVGRRTPIGSGTGRAIVMNYEDDFTWMLADLLGTVGLSVSVRTELTVGETDGADLVVLGPGPGDPNDAADRRVAKARGWVDAALNGCFSRVLAICLSHQLVCRDVGFPVRRLERANQGRQRTISLWGEPRTLAFYNSYSAYDEPGLRDRCRWKVTADGATNEIFALRRPGIETMQFHPESVLSVDGVRVVRNAIERLFG